MKRANVGIKGGLKIFRLLDILICSYILYTTTKGVVVDHNPTHTMQNPNQEGDEETFISEVVAQSGGSELFVVKPETIQGQIPVEGEEIVQWVTPQSPSTSVTSHSTPDATIVEKVAAPTTFTKVEKSLASLGFFTPSSKRLKEHKLKRINFTREVDGKRIDVPAEIIPSALFGLPVTADQDKYLALQEIITNKLAAEGEVKNPIRFKSADLLRLMHRDTNAGKNYKEIGEWLDVMTSTMIRSNGTVYVAGQKKYVTDRFHVFDRAVTVGKELDDGTIADANYVWLSSWQLGNINNKWLMPIDLETYRELKTHIAKALVPLLQVWLFATKKAGSFEKRYDDLCEILSLQCYRTPSQIERQLKPSLDELMYFEYLQKWRIEKTSDRKAFKIVFFHGAKFHRDRRRRLEQKQRTESPTIVAQSEPFEPELPEPGKFAVESETPSERNRVINPIPDPTVDGRHIDELSARGLRPSDALKLLESLPLDRLDHVSDYIEYWDDQKRKKNVGPGLLYELIKTGDPLPPDFETATLRAQRNASDDRRRKVARLKETMELKFEEYLREAVEQSIRNLPPGDFERRVEGYKAEMISQTGFWRERPEMAEQFARHAIRSEVGKDANLLTFDEFYQREVAGVLAKLQFDPADLGITQVVAGSERSETSVTDAARESAENNSSHNDAAPSPPPRKPQYP